MKEGKKAVGAVPKRADGAVMTEPVGVEQDGGVIKGYVLTSATRIAAKRPATTIRSRFFELVRGKAYLERVVAAEWNVSPETLRKHAQDADCFRYVDLTGRDGWEPCVMHPDTAKTFRAK